MISSKKYAEKIVELAYYNFPLVYPKETVIKATNALIDEYSNQLVKQKQSEIDELVFLIKEAVVCLDYFFKEDKKAKVLIKHFNNQIQKHAKK